MDWAQGWEGTELAFTATSAASFTTDEGPLLPTPSIGGGLSVELVASLGISAMATTLVSIGDAGICSAFELYYRDASLTLDFDHASNCSDSSVFMVDSYPGGVYSPFSLSFSMGYGESTAPSVYVDIAPVEVVGAATTELPANGSTLSVGGEVGDVGSYLRGNIDTLRILNFDASEAYKLHHPFLDTNAWHEPLVDETCNELP